MSNQRFYNNLPYVDEFKDITNPKYFTDVPIDWYVLVSDIKGSTQAIEEGNYNEINFIAACATTAVMNINKTIDFPFVFGGDGSTILIPAEQLEKAKDVLIDTQNFCKNAFGFDLRIGAVPVIDILRERQKISIVKLKVSDNYFQAVFHGGGLDHAEYLVKNNSKYKIPKRIPKYRADFGGLQCVMQDIPSKKEEIVSLLIKATNNSYDHTKIYSLVMNKIDDIYGNKDERFPIKPRRLRVGSNFKKAKLEALAESYQTKKPTNKIFYKKVLKVFTSFFSNIFQDGVNLLTLNAYKQTFINSIDSEKFDDMLRMVIAGNEKQRHELVGFLEEMCQQGKIAYGVHVTNSIHMTCLIFERKGKQVHFIDGSNAGYTTAAKELKNRIKWQKIYMKTF